jgi:hypothetical protein
MDSPGINWDRQGYSYRHGKRNSYFYHKEQPEDVIPPHIPEDYPRFAYNNLLTQS